MELGKRRKALQRWRGGAREVQEELYFRRGGPLRGCLRWLDLALRGLSQIYLVSNPITGLLVLAGLAVSGRDDAGPGPGWLAAFSLLGSLASTVGGVWAHQWCISEDAKAGLFGYDGALLGGAAATFLELREPEDLARGLAAVLLLGLACGPLRKALAALCSRLEMPAFTLCFNVAGLLLLQCARAGSLPLRLATAGPPLEELARPDLSDAWFWPEALLRSTGQLAFVEAWEGSALVALGLLFADAATALAALAGGAAGSALLLLLAGGGAAPAATLARARYGLLGYNSCGAVVVAAVVMEAPTARHRAAAGLLAAALSAIVTEGLATASDLPVLTVPFVLSSWVLVLSQCGMTEEETPSPSKDFQKATGVHPQEPALEHCEI